MDNCSTMIEKESNINIENNDAWDLDDEWAFGEWVDYVIPEITHNIFPKTNQAKNKETKSACTIIGCWNQIIRLFWLDLTPEESNKIGIEVTNFCTKYWYEIGSWWATYSAINAVVKRWNTIGRHKFNKEEIFRVRYTYGHKILKEALDKWHLVWFTYELNFGKDRTEWLVWRDSYPKAGWHRTNFKKTSLTKPTWWAREDTADCGVHDSYYGSTNEYLIRDRNKYWNKGFYAYLYLIMPVSAMNNTTVEEEKKKIAETKAINYVLWALSTTYSDVPAKYQEKFAALAKEMREDFEWARKLEKELNKKWGQSLVDSMSFLRKFLPENIQKEIASLAKEVRAQLKVE